MTRSPHTLNTLLIVVGVLLAVNLVAGAGRGGAHPGDKLVQPPVIPVSIAVAHEDLQAGQLRPRWLVFRLWSDGTVDMNHVGEEDFNLPRPCDGLTDRLECFTGWATIQ